MRDREADYDLGNGIRAWLTNYQPDRKLNPNSGPDIIPCGMTIEMADGCIGHVTFDVSNAAEVFKGVDRWTLNSLDPISIDPSIMRKGIKNCPEPDHTNCSHHNHHGHIHDGKWEPCGDDGAAS